VGPHRLPFYHPARPRRQEFPPATAAFPAQRLTTHKIDPDLDGARDDVLDDLLESGRVLLVR
jgi:hypothetical protein